jgi:hypothetical protein
MHNDKSNLRLVNLSNNQTLFENSQLSDANTAVFSFNLVHSFDQDCIIAIQGSTLDNDNIPATISDSLSSTFSIVKIM